MTLQLVDNSWELKLDAELDANTSIHLLGTFTNPFVVINVTSDDTLTPWRQAGTIGQAISFDSDYAHGEIKQITLDSYLLLQFPLLTGDSYDLYYFPLPRLVTAKLKIWEYKGETIDVSINELIGALQKANLPNIEDEITALAKLIQENMSSYPSVCSDSEIDGETEELNPTNLLNSLFLL